MKIKKILFYCLCVSIAIVSASMFAAFEAHIINVTAHIENGLAVNTDPIDFGTVFPQEYLEKTFAISLSDSFLDERRVDDIKYVIKQKLKPCPLVPGITPSVPIDPTCVPDTPDATPHNPTGWHYSNLCPFLSKNNTEDDGQVLQNDISHPSYFVPEQPEVPAHCVAPGPDATGILSKDIGDTVDSWTLDLKVPPVEGFVGQDWPETCLASAYVVNTNDVTYGCDLWIEATEISLPGEDGGFCTDQADVMLVLDRSGSIDAGELATLKTAAHAFATALNPDGGVHVGQTSFATNGSLDTHLTGVHVPTIANGIDGLVAGGFTNLFEGINLARGELNDANLPFERPAVPDYMVVITDGDPNRPTNIATGQAMAASEADLARADGIKVYAVGVGVTSFTETYLKTEIADDAAHYFSAADYTSLQAILEGIANCENQ